MALTAQELIDKHRRSSDKSRYDARIAALRNKGITVDHIERGIEDTVAVLERGGKSFVIYGEPQAGKTETMIALTCKLLDVGFKTIFIVMNDNTELETQNFDRFHAAPELKPTPLRDWEVNDLDVKQLRQDRPRIIFCRKNSKNLEKLIDSCRFMTHRVLIDDEADFASPNTKINKNDATEINKKVGELAKVNSDGVYIGVTATPGRLDLNNTFLNDSKNWVYLTPYPQYKGRSFFFPLTDEQIEKSDYVLTKLPETGDQPSHLKNAIYRFLVRVAVLNLTNRHNSKAFSMLIHTAGKTNDHLADKKVVESVISDISNVSLGTMSNSEELAVVDKLLKTCQEVELGDDPPAISDIVSYILDNISKNEILTINHKEDKSNVERACRPKSYFTFAIGGNIVSRGLTFENLLSFFFSRSVKGKLQQNTYIQRARMFGHRPYSQFFELAVPESLFEDWAELFQDHEQSLRLARSGHYMHIQGKKNSVADSGSIDKRNVEEVSASENPIGQIFQSSTDVEAALCQPSAQPIQVIKDLINRNMIPTEAFPEEIFAYIMEVTGGKEQLVSLVRKHSQDGTYALQNISEYSDGNEESIQRKRGGIIDAIIHKRPAYANSLVYILPIKNNFGQMRFLFKTRIGKKILKNKLGKR